MNIKKRVYDLLGVVKERNLSVYPLAERQVKLLVKSQASKEEWQAFLEDLEIILLEK